MNPKHRRLRRERRHAVVTVSYALRVRVQRQDRGNRDERTQYRYT